MPEGFSGKGRERPVFHQYLLRSHFSSDSICCLTALRRFVEERKSQLLGYLLIATASDLMSCKGPAGGELVSGAERRSVHLRRADADPAHSASVLPVLYSEQL